MYYERVTKATVESVLGFIKDAAELNECAISNGFGLQGGKAASQDVALFLSADVIFFSICAFTELPDIPTFLKALQ